MYRHLGMPTAAERAKEMDDDEPPCTGVDLQIMFGQLSRGSRRGSKKASGDGKALASGNSWEDAARYVGWNPTRTGLQINRAVVNTPARYNAAGAASTGKFGNGQAAVTTDDAAQSVVLHEDCSDLQTDLTKENTSAGNSVDAVNGFDDVDCYERNLSEACSDEKSCERTTKMTDDASEVNLNMTPGSYDDGAERSTGSPPSAHELVDARPLSSPASMWRRAFYEEPSETLLVVKGIPTPLSSPMKPARTSVKPLGGEGIAGGCHGAAATTSLELMRQQLDYLLNRDAGECPAAALQANWSLEDSCHDVKSQPLEVNDIRELRDRMKASENRIVALEERLRQLDEPSCRRVDYDLDMHPTVRQCKLREDMDRVQNARQHHWSKEKEEQFCAMSERLKSLESLTAHLRISSRRSESPEDTKSAMRSPRDLKNEIARFFGRAPTEDVAGSFASPPKHSRDNNSKDPVAVKALSKEGRPVFPPESCTNLPLAPPTTSCGLRKDYAAPRAWDKADPSLRLTSRPSHADNRVGHCSQHGSPRPLIGGSLQSSKRPEPSSAIVAPVHSVIVSPGGRRAYNV